MYIITPQMHHHSLHLAIVVRILQAGRQAHAHCPQAAVSIEGHEPG